MSAQQFINPPQDEILIFMPELARPERADEYAARCKLRTVRNCSAYRATKAEDDSARALAWMANEWANAFLFARTDTARLQSVAEFGRRLLVLADQAEEIANVVG